MSAVAPSPLDRREARARRNTKPELDRDKGEVWIIHPNGQVFCEYLLAAGISGSLSPDAAADVITLPRGTDLDRVQSMIDAWLAGQAPGEDEVVSP